MTIRVSMATIRSNHSRPAAIDAKLIAKMAAPPRHHLEDPIACLEEGQRCLVDVEFLVNEVLHAAGRLDGLRGCVGIDSGSNSDSDSGSTQL